MKKLKLWKIKFFLKYAFHKLPLTSGSSYRGSEGQGFKYMIKNK